MIVICHRLCCDKSGWQTTPFPNFSDDDVLTELISSQVNTSCKFGPVRWLSLCQSWKKKKQWINLSGKHRSFTPVAVRNCYRLKKGVEKAGSAGKRTGCCLFGLSVCSQNVIVENWKPAAWLQPCLCCYLPISSSILVLAGVLFSCRKILFFSSENWI